MSRSLIIASISPRREQLFKKTTDDFVVMGSGYREPENFSAHELAISNAKCKANSCLEQITLGFTRFNDRIILAADTVVVVDGQLLNKPKSDCEARNMLKMLSNRAHKVITGVCFCVDGNMIVDCDESIVEFSQFSDHEIDCYIASGSPFDKAGGYGIQDDFIRNKTRRILGSLDNIIGLPTQLISRMIALHNLDLRNLCT